MKEILKSQTIETPSWGYGNSGTRFKVFAQPGVPRDPYEKLDDTAQVHRYTGVAPVVSLQLRRLLHRTQPLLRYEPRGQAARWEEAEALCA